MFPALAGAQAAAIQSDKVYLAQVMLCARHIGIELDSEHFYIAERAREVFFERPLPPPWRLVAARSTPVAGARAGEPTYYNPATRERTTQHPSAAFYRAELRLAQRDQSRERVKGRQMRPLNVDERLALAKRERAARRKRRKRRAAEVIQSCFRGWRARHVAWLLLRQRHVAATVMQAGWRGSRGRQLAHGRKRVWAAETFQSWWQARQWRRGPYRQMKAAVVLQRGVRRWRERRAAHRLQMDLFFTEETSAAALVQKAFRRRAEKMRGRKEFELSALVAQHRADETFFESRHIPTGRVYGMRVYHRDAACERAERHMAAMQKAEGVPYLANVHSGFRFRDKFYAVVDFLNVDVLSLRASLGGTAMASPELAEMTRRIAAEVLVAMLVLGSRRLVYRGLRCSRVRLDAHGRVALSDAGVTELGYGTGPAVDLGSFGNFLMEMYTGITTAGVEEPLQRRALIRQASGFAPKAAGALFETLILSATEESRRKASGQAWQGQGHSVSIQFVLEHSYFDGLSLDELELEGNQHRATLAEEAEASAVKPEPLPYETALLEQRVAKLGLLVNQFMFVADPDQQTAEAQELQELRKTARARKQNLSFADVVRRAAAIARGEDPNQLTGLAGGGVQARQSLAAVALAGLAKAEAEGPAKDESNRPVGLLVPGHNPRLFFMALTALRNHAEESLRVPAADSTDDDEDEVVAAPRSARSTAPPARLHTRRRAVLSSDTASFAAKLGPDHEAATLERRAKRAELRQAKVQEQAQQQKMVNQADSVRLRHAREMLEAGKARKIVQGKRKQKNPKTFQKLAREDAKDASTADQLQLARERLFVFEQGDAASARKAAMRLTASEAERKRVLGENAERRARLKAEAASRNELFVEM